MRGAILLMLYVGISIGCAPIPSKTLRPLRQSARFWGIGWSEGYHQCPTCTTNECTCDPVLPRQGCFANGCNSNVCSTPYEAIPCSTTALPSTACPPCGVGEPCGIHYAPTTSSGNYDSFYSVPSQFEGMPNEYFTPGEQTHQSQNKVPNETLAAPLDLEPSSDEDGSDLDAEMLFEEIPPGEKSPSDRQGRSTRSPFGQMATPIQPAPMRSARTVNMNRYLQR